LHMTTA